MVGQGMNSADRRPEGKSGIDLIEEAVHLLRAASLAALAIYYLGALPFVLALLYFWADMSGSAFANQHLAGAALGVASLFLWMKFWQALFARQLRGLLAGQSLPPVTVSRCLQLFVTP